MSKMNSRTAPHRDIDPAADAIHSTVKELKAAGRNGQAQRAAPESPDDLDVSPEKSPYCGHCEYGWVMENGRARRCECTRRTVVVSSQDRIESLLRRHRAGMSKKLSRVSDHTFITRPGHEHIKPALDQYIRDLAAGKSYGFFIFGPTNVGKSFAAAYVVNTVRHLRLLTAAMINFSRSLSALQSTFKHEDDHQALLSVLFHTPLLAIDDLGMEYRAGDKPELSWAVAKFYEIIDYRREEELPTLITSNRTPEELKDRLGDAIMSRIMALTLRLDMGPVTGTDPGAGWGSR